MTPYFDSIPSCVLGTVHGAVGMIHQCINGCTRTFQFCHADTYRHMQYFGRNDGAVHCLEELAHFFRSSAFRMVSATCRRILSAISGRALGAGGRKKDNELLAAMPPDNIHATYVLRADLCDHFQDQSPTLCPN